MARADSSEEVRVSRSRGAGGPTDVNSNVVLTSK
jgi:hypothetical protein